MANLAAQSEILHLPIVLWLPSYQTPNSKSAEFILLRVCWPCHPLSRNPKQLIGSQDWLENNQVEKTHVISPNHVAHILTYLLRTACVRWVSHTVLGVCEGGRKLTKFGSALIFQFRICFHDGACRHSPQKHPHLGRQKYMLDHKYVAGDASNGHLDGSLGWKANNFYLIKTYSKPYPRVQS